MTRSDGISYRMWDERPLPRWSLPGLYAGIAAQRQGPELFERFHIEMFAAYFSRSEDITSKDVVVKVARRSGLDVDRFSLEGLYCERGGHSCKVFSLWYLIGGAWYYLRALASGQLV